MYQNCLKNVCSEYLVRYNSRFLHKNHYEVLNLQSNCTQKEIRESFVKLSKEFHPDTAKTSSTQDTANFQKIIEAYRILGKSDSRVNYDFELSSNNTASFVRSSDINYEEYWKSYRNPNPSSYYGIDGMQKISNKFILLLIFAFTSIGVLMQCIAIRHSMTFRRSKLDQNSRAAGENHSLARNDAEKYGNEEQMLRIAKRMQ